MRINLKWIIAAGLLLVVALVVTLTWGPGQSTIRTEPVGLPNTLEAKRNKAPPTLPAGSKRVTAALVESERMTAKNEEEVAEWVTLRSAYATPLGPGRIKLAGSTGWDPLLATQAEGFQLSALNSTRIVRFNGYLEQAIPPGPGLFELTAESSLTFRSPPGSPPTEAWDYSFQDYVLSPLGAKATQLITVGTRLVLISNLATDLRNLDTKYSTSFQIQLTSGSFVRGIWNARPGEHDEVTLGVEQTGKLDTRDLQISVRSQHPPQAANKSWHWQLHNGKAPVDTVHLEGSWGSLSVDRSFGLRGEDVPRLRSTGSPALFKDMLVGVSYLAAVHSQDWSEIGQGRFVFDGTPITIETTPGWLIEAQVFDSQTLAPISQTAVRIFMDFSLGNQRDILHLLWNGHKDIVSDREGIISAALLTRLPGSFKFEWAPPTEVDLRIRVSGYEDLIITATRDPDFEGIMDLGPVKLTPLEASFQFRLLSATEKDLDYAYVGSTTRQDSEKWPLTTWPALGADRLYNARLRNDRGDRYIQEIRLFLDRVQLAAARAEGLILTNGNERFYAFEAVGDIWQEVPSKDWNLPISEKETPGSTPKRLIGYTWRGVDISLGIFRDRWPTWAFRAPLEGVEIWIADLDTEGQLIRRPTTIKLEDGAVLKL